MRLTSIYETGSNRSADHAGHAESGGGYRAGASREQRFCLLGCHRGGSPSARRHRRLECERRLGEHWAIAPAIEHAFGELNFTVVTLSVGYRFDNWAVFAGPGIEWAQYEHDSNRSATESEFLFRTGIMYHEAGELIVAPHAIVDFVADEKVVVFGVTMAWVSSGGSQGGRMLRTSAMFARNLSV